VAGADGQRQGGNLHLRLGRQPLRSRHAQRQRHPAPVPGSARGRLLPVRITDVARRGPGAWPAPGDPRAGMALGADLLPDPRARLHPPPAQEPRVLSRQNLSNTAGPSDDQRGRRPADGAQDASRDQAARRTGRRLARLVGWRTWRSPLIQSVRSSCERRPGSSPAAVAVAELIRCDRTGHGHDVHLVIVRE
jgi:hypothetical protein